MASIVLSDINYHYHIDEKINMSYYDSTCFTFQYDDSLFIWNNQVLYIVSGDRMAIFRDGRWMIMYKTRAYYYRDPIVKYRDRTYYRNIGGGGCHYGNLHFNIGSEVTITYRYYQFVIQGEYSYFSYGSYFIEHYEHQLIALRHPRFYARYRNHGDWDVYSTKNPFRELIPIQCTIPINLTELITSIVKLL